ncbi:NAD(P)H-dependent glycerol-3-phosphate dehydrogenase [Sporomusa acidovorans]|uniref:Glycerol-3-phosphate dehydrogenase [NAD(P)+] n=1 Tax=Sporomusa acidovorans (strain ATCC 49682 / DSM 3132 / Mol) TaxID=1123286 RepID=A0ABZ3J383_SPOA4|nr:NAD(P)H-dependent glycerol-3-phosphate dehydrogenase [Sporomusa acidovorans]OZC20299.1 glycerol-3-phosphate dehydrogenase [Sporomusa acidovorans DSM 3132]SDD38825.1 glycerol 3-phosphate dehydrogenase (NAD(P)+) [Sporomusa acidovorans]
MHIAVIGAGSWGTAITAVLGQKHHSVRLWVRSPELSRQIQVSRENANYLPGCKLPQSVLITPDLKEAAAGASLIVLATPSHAVRQTVAKLSSYVSPETILVNVAKGLELSSLKRLSETIVEELPAIANQIAILSGPNHAEEVALAYPTATVVAAKSRKVAEYIQDAFMQPYFRVYTNPDIIGVELAGALKNIIALGAGIADGLGFGDNAKSALMTRGLAEIARLGISMGANPLTFAGLAGIGDLIATCTSSHSRNRRAGLMLASGKSVNEIQTETSMVVEGIRATKAAYQLAVKQGIDMPITNQIYQVLYQNKSPKDAVFELMTRSRTHEVEEVALHNSSWD